MACIELREVTKDSLPALLRVEVAEGQRHLVATTSVSIAEAFFEPKAWFRGIYRENVPVGFIMLYDDVETPEYVLWRLLIGREHQRKGYGRAAVAQLIDYVRTRPGAAELKVSWVPDPQSPEAFYRRLGFELTGEVHEGEVVARLVL